MPEKRAEIACPCCQSRLEVDLASGKLLGWKRGDGGGEEHARPATRDLDELAARVRERSARGEEQLGAALERERTKGDDLERRFDDLNRKHTSGEPEE